MSLLAETLPTVEPAGATGGSAAGVGVEQELPAAAAGVGVEVVADPRMRAVMAQAERAARSRATLLIEGESGSGKEVVARAVHRLGPRREAPFLAVNCAALPEGLVESELFGHERGAFTGAEGARAGRFEAAHGGTLLLDEVSEMPLPLQAKLLRVLQERSVERVGSGRPIAFDVRVIATTNRDLEAEVRRGSFRLDLFYRLAVLRLQVPALRERPLDVPALALSFLPPGRRFSPEALRALRSHSWPGNVRELHNVVERAAVLGDQEVIGPDCLRLHAPSIEAPTSAPRGTLEEVEQLCIRAALEECGGNRTHAARRLGISIRTLRNRLAEYRRAGIFMAGERS